MLNLPLRVLLVLALLAALAVPNSPTSQQKEGGCLDPLGRPVPCQHGP